MASQLKLVEKINIRPVKKTIGSVVSFLATAEKDIYINPALILSILKDFGVGPAGEKVHKIVLSDRREICVNDTALTDLTT